MPTKKYSLKAISGGWNVVDAHDVPVEGMSFTGEDATLRAHEALRALQNKKRLKTKTPPIIKAANDVQEAVYNALVDGLMDTEVGENLSRATVGRSVYQLMHQLPQEVFDLPKAEGTFIPSRIMKGIMEDAGTELGTPVTKFDQITEAVINEYRWWRFKKFWKKK